MLDGLRSFTFFLQLGAEFVDVLRGEFGNGLCAENRRDMPLKTDAVIL
jgi:hypothetical protein